MALLSLLFNRPTRLQIGEGSDTLVVVDAADNISHQLDAEPTEHPIEDGSEISDHVDIKPRQLTFNGIVSEAPISIGGAVLGNIAGAIGGIVGRRSTSLVGAGAAALSGSLLNAIFGNPAEQAFKNMTEIQEKKIPCTIITGLNVYNDMVLTSFNPVESAGSGKSLQFTATFRQVVTVPSEALPSLSGLIDAAVGPSASSTLGQGKRVAGAANDSVGGRGQSLLSLILGVGA